MTYPQLSASVNCRTIVLSVREMGGLWLDLGDEVVVVGVEPLGHFLRRHPRVAACQREVQVEALAAAKALRDCPEEECDVQDLVVERRRVGQRGIRSAESEFDEARQVGLA